MIAVEVLLYILAFWGYFVLWFFAVGTYVRMERDGSLRGVPTFIFRTLYVMLIPGVIVDFVFNITYGTLHYRAIPRDWLFSGTTARVLREDPSHKRALRWKRILNAIDPGHI